MFGDLFRLIADFFQFLWPLRIVDQWEQGGYYIFGRWVRPVKPGLYPIIPWFFDVKTVSIAEAIIGTGRQDITMRDGTTLSFSATATVRVIDPFLAINKVDTYQETMRELLSSVLAERLADIDPDRLSTNKRNRLHTDLKGWVALEAAEYGVEVSKVRFTSFLTNIRSHRLLVDQTSNYGW